MARLYGDRLYVELQRHGIAAERAVEPALIGLAYAQSIPLVATNEPFFARREDYEAHDALICIAEGRLVAETDRRQLTAEHYFKSRAEMAALFADLPEALASTVEIAERCAFRPRTHDPILPRFSVGDRTVDEAAELRVRAEAGLERRLQAHGLAPGRTIEEYRERLAFEVKVIEGMKYPGYFLIVSDFIQWAKEQGIPVGPGRGSGAGSLVSYALTITDLDPLRFDLLFERFLNPERVSMPDFDIDFCQDRRDEVIRYVQERYGRDQVAQIITFGTLQARGVLRDVGRVLEMPYGQVDKLCKLVPQNPAAPVTLAKAIEGEPRLQAERDGDPRVKRAFDIALKLEGLYRHASTHAAGIVIGDRPLAELVPLYRDPKSDMPVTQFNMKWVEAAGLVKFDFLGLKTLTVLQTAVGLLKQRGVELDLSAIPLDDAKTYALLARAEAVGIFQLESQGMRRALLDMRPDRFEDIIALVALYRPGPMANIPTYCLRKHGVEKPEYIHPKLEPILRETFGVIVYQEQVMQAAQILAGYTLGQADLLRRAMGKKIRKEMQEQRAHFVQGRDRARHRPLARRRDLRPARAFRRIRLQQEPRRGLRAGRLSDRVYEGELSGRVPRRVDDARHGQHRQALRVSRRGGAARASRSSRPASTAPASQFDVDGNTIHYALAALKGVGAQAVEAIVAARGDKPFTDLADFARRINPRAVNKRVLESLAAAGRVRPRSSRTARGPMPRSMRCSRPRSAPTRRCRSGRTNCSAARPAARSLPLPAAEAVAAGRPAAARIRRHRLLPVRPSARRLRRAAQGHEGAVLGRVLARGEVRRQRRPGRRDRGVARRAAHQDRQQDGHHRPVRSVRPLRGGAVRRRAAAIPRHARAGLAGAAVPHRAKRRATRSARASSPPSRSIRPPPSCRRGCAVFLRDPAPIEPVAKRLEGKGDGEISMVLLLDGGNEVEVQAARPLQDLAADRRRHQGGARRGRSPD